MIDWGTVFVNAVWILGAAVLLSAFSYHWWMAAETGLGMWRRASWRISLTAGTGLIAAGWALHALVY